jgi:hypothetical protein
MSGRGRAGVVVATALLAFAAAGIAWSIGDALANDITDPDYMLEPSETLVDNRWLILGVTVVVAVGCVVALVRLASRGATVNFGVVAPVVGIGVAIGGGYAVVTAPVIGANIGGGMVMMGLPILVVFLVIAAVKAARRANLSSDTRT